LEPQFSKFSSYFFVLVTVLLLTSGKKEKNKVQNEVAEAGLQEDTGIRLNCCCPEIT
jgi:hypothetical protein